MNDLQFHEHMRALGRIENYQKVILNKLQKMQVWQGITDEEIVHSLEEESKKEEVGDTKTYAEALLRDTWNMLDNLHMIGFSYGSVIGGIRYDNKGRRIERKTVKIDEYHALRKKVAHLGIIK